MMKSQLPMLKKTNDFGSVQVVYAEPSSQGLALGWQARCLDGGEPNTDHTIPQAALLRLRADQC